MSIFDYQDPRNLDPKRRTAKQLAALEDERIELLAEQDRNREAEAQARRDAADPSKIKHVGDPFTVVSIQTGQYTDRFAGKGEGVEGICAALASAAKRGAKVPTQTGMQFTTVYANPKADLAIVSTFAGYDAQCVGGWSSFQLDADGKVDSAVDFK